jgi:hypothetical protein
MTPADLALADDHLRRAAEAGDSYGRFEWAWKAFNVLYFPESRSGQDNRDLGRIKRTASRVAAQAPEFFNQDSLGRLVNLPLIFDEKIWRDSGEENNERHRDVCRLLRACTSFAVPSSTASRILTDRGIKKFWVPLLRCCWTW